MDKIRPIDMDSDTFAAMKTDMTTQINRLLRHMQRYHAEKAAVTVKLTVTLDEEELDDGVKGTVPTFEHKVTSTVQIKDETSGKIDNEYVLAEGKDGRFELRPISGQLDMFEEPV